MTADKSPDSDNPSTDAEVQSFIETGQATPEFLDRLDRETSLQEAVDAGLGEVSAGLERALATLLPRADSISAELRRVGREQLGKVAEDWQGDFLEFVETGEASPEFLQYLDSDVDAQSAAQAAFERLDGWFSELESELSTDEAVPAPAARVLAFRRIVDSCRRVPRALRPMLATALAASLVGGILLGQWQGARSGREWAEKDVATLQDWLDETKVELANVQESSVREMETANTRISEAEGQIGDLEQRRQDLTRQLASISAARQRERDQAAQSVAELGEQLALARVEANEADQLREALAAARRNSSEWQQKYESTFAEVAAESDAPGSTGYGVEYGVYSDLLNRLASGWSETGKTGEKLPIVRGSLPSHQDPRTRAFTSYVRNTGNLLLDSRAGNDLVFHWPAESKTNVGAYFDGWWQSELPGNYFEARELLGEGELVPPRVVRRGKYSKTGKQLAKQLRFKGRVVVQVLVDEFGGVADVWAPEQDPPVPNALVGGALAAARKTVFEPGTAMGTPVKSIQVLEYRFD